MATISRSKAGETLASEYQGDIYALEKDADELLTLGVEIGPFRAGLGCFENCHLSSQALRRLQVLGGKYLWDLEPVEGKPEAFPFEFTGMSCMPRYH
ncbi:hypothetical protein [Azoarcus olearius]|uniref:Uncharacterized protein n=1 Tax=Azoarcus sp. (strain BH72) TaxID=418699 RepID=A1K878_AZOSB|nr:hypothetical protein [Azoarcus olearius]ANQ85590.1 hypothetical protein dqs_2560 [Azoarcus olearius]CAL95033.1 hypothetical protein predicted by Glimmer/Critica [Azoarcus olearius]